MKDIDKIDIQITLPKQWFRCRACGIIIENGCVLCVSNPNVDYYYSVGGGVQIGETTEEACLREVFEETGINYQIDRLAFVHQNYFYIEDRIHHEITFYYLMKSKGNQELNSNSYALDGVKETLLWVPINEYDHKVIYPLFLKNELLNLSNEVKFIVSKEF